ncbi:MAG TPA: L,D-transpeptidase [Acidimicrobiales bacterium]|nr:L,D-transpeptidase [Acidimicrobiales bacterium]
MSPSALAVLVPVTVAASLWVGTGVSASASNAAAAAVPRTQELALLLGPHEAMSRPAKSSTAIQLVNPKRPLTGEQTALPVIGHRTGAHGTQWLHVMLPGRPDGHTGWIERTGTAHAVTPWHIVVDTALRRVTVYRDGDRVRTIEAIVGKPSTPTPDGEFFVEEVVELRPNDVGAPYALALSARSAVYQEFDGGPGQIALHGLANIGGVLGTAASHGCVRLDGSAMTWLVTRIGPGVPVTITSRAGST